MSIIVVSIYFLVLFYIFLFSVTEFGLAINYLNSKNKIIDKEINSLDTYPIVTIQLPVYNELYVVERLIDSVVQIDWPKDRLEIQILGKNQKSHSKTQWIIRGFAMHFSKSKTHDSQRFCNFSLSKFVFRKCLNFQCFRSTFLASVQYPSVNFG